jgi:Taurine catabolism dioxygenase TauD, TfdA family
MTPSSLPLAMHAALASQGYACHTALASQGYAYLSAFSADPTGLRLLTLARTLGPLYLPPGVDSARPILETHPTPTASYLTPFDRPEALGWHNDFSTHTARPAVSLAYLARPDPRGPEHGAWRVASSDLVIEQLHATPEGREAMRLLLYTDLPYSFTGEGSPVFFRAVARRGPPPGRLGLRFYGRAMRDGARLAYGSVPPLVEHALATVEAAADRVGRTLAAPAGALLVTDNWHSLHDRLPLSVEPDLPPRRSLLCFVEVLHEPLPVVPPALR